MANELIAGLLLDLDGVIENDEGLEAGAIELAQVAADIGLPTAIVTNDIRSCCYDRAHQLAEWGFPVKPELFVTPYDTLLSVLGSNKLKAPRFFGALPPARLQDVWAPSDGDVDCIVLGDLRDAIGHLADCLTLIEQGLPLFALQKNSFVRSNGKFVADVGYHVAAWEHCLSAKATVLGKPAPHAYEVACARLDVKPILTYMISDNFSSDLMGALSLGMSVIFVERYALTSEVALARRAGIPIAADLIEAIDLLVTYATQ